MLVPFVVNWQHFIAFILQ